ncbi:MAG TPA: molybdopterin-dependent oxidoreductase [Sandaracinaceae bacterium LLY-WYZ-13_1]|nr:molybdopterin-dependent oxidoreductase [Sandaracinaceae bacterium LLY-WYZ-13_1]
MSAPDARTYCRICEAACGLELRDGRLRPDRAHPISRGFVCAKGTRFTEVAHHPARLRAPAIRRGDGALARVGWETAIEEAAARLRAVIDRHGPHAVGLYVGNPLAFHAAGQLAAVFFGRALGTRNVFTAGSQDCNNKFAAGSLLHGSPVLQPIPDFERADLAVLFGTNPAVSQSSFVHLEGGASIFDRMAARGARTVWVDVRRTESAARWGELVRVRPGTDAWLILALLSRVAEVAPRARLEDPRVEGLEALLALARSTAPAAPAITGVAPEAIDALADAIASTPRTALHMSVGVNQGPFGTLSYVALQALAFVAGCYDRRGGSLFSPVGVAGARLARAAGLFTSEARSRVGGFPTVFDSLPGGVMADEIRTDGPERIRAMVVIAGDPVRSIPGAGQLEEALASLESLVCLDLFENRTGRHADVLLPVASWLERADLALPGLPLQTVDLLQTTAAVMPRFAETRPDHEILAALSLAMDRPLFGSRLVARALARPGLVDRWLPRLSERAWRLLDGDPARRGLGIPVPVPKPGTYLGRGPMTPGRRVRFWHPSLEREGERLRAWAPAEGFVLLGRRRRLGHNSWLHGATRDGAPEAEAWMAPADLEALGVEDGGEVTLRTEAGALALPVRAREGVAPGTVVVPHGERAMNVNALLPAGPAQIEPVSGMLTMTGVPVDVQPARAAVAARS